jgi:glutathione peroxidase
MKNLYSFSVKTASGDVLDLATLKGRVVLIVNVASQCGYTKQYKELQELHAKLSPKGLTLLGFPCNQFGGQEPETCDVIDRETSKKFGRTFQLLDKVDVNGANAAPIFKEFLNPESKVSYFSL